MHEWAFSGSLHIREQRNRRRLWKNKSSQLLTNMKIITSPETHTFKKHFFCTSYWKRDFFCKSYWKGFTRLAQTSDDWYEHLFHKFCGCFLSSKFLLWAIYLHSQPSWALFTSNSPSQEQWSSFSTGSFFALGSCLILTRLVTSCSNSMKSPIMISIPHNTPW